jgi:hypothetical protein
MIIIKNIFKREGGTVNREKRIHDEVNKTLQALDDLPRLEANPYLYTRIKAALVESAPSRSGVLRKTINVRSLAFSLLVVLNLITAVYFFSMPRRDALKEELIYNLSDDYKFEQIVF